MVMRLHWLERLLRDAHDAGVLDRRSQERLGVLWRRQEVRQFLKGL